MVLGLYWTAVLINKLLWKVKYTIIHWVKPNKICIMKYSYILFKVLNFFLTITVLLKCYSETSLHIKYENYILSSQCNKCMLLPWSYKKVTWLVSLVFQSSTVHYTKRHTEPSNVIPLNNTILLKLAYSNLGSISK